MEELFDTPFLKKIASAIIKPKIEISKAIKVTIEEKNLSLRKISALINDLGFDEYKASYAQVNKVTSGDNYKIDTLLKVLDALDLTIVIKPKSKHD